MEKSQFDDLARDVARSTSRRTMAKAGLAAVIGAALNRFGVSETEAAKRRRYVGETCRKGSDCLSGICEVGDDRRRRCQFGITPACTTGIDRKTKSEWVVCRSDENSAWISHTDPSGGEFHANEICRQLGYQGLGQYGGTCGSVCGYCESGTSCSNLGSEVFDGGGDCEEGTICHTVQWTCVNVV